MSESFEVLIEGILSRGYGEVFDLIPQHLLHSLLKRLKQLEKQDLLRPAMIGPSTEEHVFTKIRSDKIFWLDPESTQPAVLMFLDLMNQLAEYITKTCFISLNHSEFHFAHYQKGTFYHRHLDRFKGGIARKFTVILYLNENWLVGDGGELALYLEQTDPVYIQPTWGKLVMFESAEIEHEVMKSNTDRYSITGWLRYDDKTFFN